MSVGNIGIWIDQNGSLSPTETLSTVPFEGTSSENRNDGGYTYSSGNNSVAVTDAGNYLVLYHLHIVDTSVDRGNVVGNVAVEGTLVKGSNSSSYKRDTNNTHISCRGSAIVSLATADEVTIEWKRGSDSNVISSVAGDSNIMILRLPDDVDAAYAHYSFSSGQALLGSTYNDVVIDSVIRQTNTSKIERTTNEIELKTPNTNYLISYSIDGDTANPRTQRVSRATVEGSPVAGSYGYAYQRNSSNEFTAPTATFIYRTGGTSETLKIQCCREDGVHAWATIDDGDFLTTVNGGVMIVELPSSAETFISHDGTAAQDVTLAPTLNAVTDVDHNDSDSFTKVNDTTMNIEKSMDVLLLGSVLTNRPATSGTRTSFYGYFANGGTPIPLSEHYTFIRGDQSSTDTTNGSVNTSWLGNVTLGDDITFETGDSGSSGGVDLSLPDTVGFSALNIGSLLSVGVQTATFDGMVVNTYSDSIGSTRNTVNSTFTGQVANTYASKISNIQTGTLKGQVANTYSKSVNSVLNIPDKHEATMNGIDHGITMATVTLYAGDVVSFKTKSYTIGYFLDYHLDDANRPYFLIRGDGTLEYNTLKMSATLDGSPIVSWGTVAPLDNDYHEYVVSISATCLFDVIGRRLSFSEFGDGIIKDIDIVRVAPTAQDPDLHWAVNDGFAVDPLIKETAVNDGTWDGTAENFVAGTWTTIQTASLKGQVVNTYSDELDSTSNTVISTFTGQVVNTYGGSFVPSRYTNATIKGQVTRTYSEGITPSRFTNAELTGQVGNSYSSNILTTKFTDATLLGQVVNTYADTIQLTRYTNASLDGQAVYTYTGNVDTLRFTTANLNRQDTDTYAGPIESARYTNAVLDGQVSGTYSQGITTTKFVGATLIGQIAYTFADPVTSTKHGSATLDGQVANTYSPEMLTNKGGSVILSGQLSRTYSGTIDSSRYTTGVIFGQVANVYNTAIETSRFTSASLDGQLATTFSSPISTVKFTNATLLGQLVNTYADPLLTTPRGQSDLYGQIVRTYNAQLETTKHGQATLSGALAKTYGGELTSLRYTVATITGQVATTYTVALDTVKFTVASLSGQLSATYSGAISSTKFTEANLIGQIVNTHSEPIATTKHVDSILYGQVASTYSGILYGYTNTITYNPDNIKTVSITEKYITNSAIVKYSTVSKTFESQAVSVTIDTVTISDSTIYSTIKE